MKIAVYFFPPNVISVAAHFASFFFFFFFLAFWLFGFFALFDLCLASAITNYLGASALLGTHRKHGVQSGFISIGIQLKCRKSERWISTGSSCPDCRGFLQVTASTAYDDAPKLQLPTGWSFK